MPRRCLARILAILATLSVGLVVSADTYKAPRTPWGDPDLQGIWPGNMGVPMQRPAEFGERAELTEAEFGRRQSQAATQAKTDAEIYVKPGDGRAASADRRTGSSVDDRRGRRRSSSIRRTGDYHR